MKPVIWITTAALGIALMLAIGGYNGEHNLPYVDEYGRVASTWGGNPIRVYDCPQATPSACEAGALKQE